MPIAPAGPCGQSVAMQWLVSPDLTVYTIADLESLDKLTRSLRIHSKLAGCLRQLMGFRIWNNDGRTGRYSAENWQKLESVRWLRHVDTSELVPLIGSFVHIQRILAHLGLHFHPPSLKNLFNRRLKKLRGWVCVETPDAAWRLPHGTSLFHLNTREGIVAGGRRLALLANPPMAAQQPAGTLQHVVCAGASAAPREEAVPVSLAPSCRCGTSAFAESVYVTPSMQSEMAMEESFYSLMQSKLATMKMAMRPVHEQQHSVRDPAALAAALTMSHLGVEEHPQLVSVRERVKRGLVGGGLVGGGLVGGGLVEGGSVGESVATSVGSDEASVGSVENHSAGGSVENHSAGRSVENHSAGGCVSTLQTESANLRCDYTNLEDVTRRERELQVELEQLRRAKRELEGGGGGGGDSM